jgi:hypothetical protein
MIGMVGTEVVMLMNVGSLMFLSFKARITASVSGFRSTSAGAGVRLTSGFVGRWKFLAGATGETEGGGVCGKIAVDCSSGVMYRGSATGEIGNLGSLLRGSDATEGREFDGVLRGFELISVGRLVGALTGVGLMVFGRPR